MELRTGEIFSEHLAIHVLELRHLFERGDGERPELLKWGWFLQASRLEVLDALAEGDPSMTLAKDTLVELSADEEARRLALERDLQAIRQGVTMSATFDRGRVEGRVEMLLKGLAARGDVLTADQRDRLSSASAAQLDRWLERAMRGVPLAELFTDG